MTEIPASLKDEIQAAYRHYLDSKEFKPRYGQRLMIAEVVKGLMAEVEEGGAISVIEAGTGTGKTVAYLLAAIPLARHLDKRLVVSTATVALQEQIVHKDLPDLLEHSGLEFSFELAKGRGRYLCLAKLDQLLQQHESVDPNQSLYEDEQFLRLDERAHRLYQSLGESYVKGDWNGDRDNWPQELSETDWRPVTTDHRQCTNRRCSHFSGCSFFKAREGLDKADCVVANHDLVLSDLALGGGAILSEPEETLYVFDEGHHLADKAIQHFSAKVRLRGSRTWLKQLPKTLARLVKELGNPDPVVRCLAPLDELLAGIEPLLQQAESMTAGLQEQVTEERDRAYFRFPDGLLPQELVELAGQLQRLYTRVVNQLDSLAELLKEAISEPLAGIPREGAERWFAVVGQLQARAEGALQLWRDYAQADRPSPVPQARWIGLLDEKEGGDQELASSPILASDTLRQNLWQRCFGAVVTSATLTALGRFDHLRMLTGLPEHGRYSRVPSPFDYQQAAQLCVPRLKAAPSEVDAHDAEVVEFLEQGLVETESALVLFTSWRQMLSVRDGLGAALRRRVLAQGDHSKQELLRRHREAVDAGVGSVLFGLASFAEGVDLPGDYLKHVVIAKIPFAVPGHPVEAALHEWVRHRGGNPFMEISVPDASVKLIQACGRLLRSEQDSGRISILDTRLSTRQYGRALLEALPPFRRI